MGILRLLLALSVLIFHSGMFFNYNIANERIAVFSFFIISGFYMALILDKKYKSKKARFLFWTNRALRIFPVYWAALSVLTVFILLKFFFHMGTGDNALTHYLINAPNITQPEFYLNLLNFISRNITLVLSADYFRVNNSVPGYLLIPQAWTLQIELLFYIIAPFLAKFSKKLFIGVSVFYIISFFGIIVPRNLMPPNLTFQFLNNLIFFLLGMASYKFLYTAGFFRSKMITPGFLNLLFISFVLYLLLYNYLPFKVPLPILNLEDFFYFSLFTLAIPFIFRRTSLNKTDKLLGSLSYPVYITHLILIKMLSNTKMFVNPSSLKTILVIVSTLSVSYLLVRYVDDPVDRYRQDRLKPQ